MEAGLDAKFITRDGKQYTRYPGYIYTHAEKQRTDKPYLEIDDFAVYPVNQKALDMVSNIYEIFNAFDSSQKICIHMGVSINGKHFANCYNMKRLVRRMFLKYEKNINREEKCDFPDSCQIHVYQSSTFKYPLGNVDNTLLKKKHMFYKKWKTLTKGDRGKYFYHLTLQPGDKLPYSSYYDNIISLTIPDDCWDAVENISPGYWFHILTKEQQAEYHKRFKH